MTKKHFYVYNSSGRILRSGYCPEDVFALQASCDGEVVAEGIADPLNQLISDGALINIPTQPSKYHRWDWDSLCWKNEITFEIERVRRIRNVKLQRSDWVDSPGAESRISTQELAEWQSYRQKLREMTENFDPENVVWPEQPGTKQPEFFTIPTYTP